MSAAALQALPRTPATTSWYTEQVPGVHTKDVGFTSNCWYDPDSTRPTKWWCHEKATDQHGREWSRVIVCVVDDFGTLVEVPA